MNPVYLIIIPLLSAFSIPLFGLISKKLEKFIPPLAMLFNLIYVIILIPQILKKPIIVLLGGFTLPFGINLFIGPLGIIFTGVIAIVGFVTSLYAINYIKEGDKEKYHMLYLLLLTGATGVVLTGDIFNLFVFFEILFISSFALVAYLGDKRGIEASAKYLIQGSVGSGFMLLGIGFLYGQFGTLNMAHLAQIISMKYAATHSISINLFIPLVFFIIGFGIEGSIFPLNAWLPDAHSSAPSTISAILSGLAIEIGLYAIIRFVFTIFGITSILPALAILGLITLIIGEITAFAQTNIKRMLAYSSIGQLGLMFFAISIGTAEAITGGLFQFLTHAFSKALLFLSVGYMIYKTKSMEISSFKGIAKNMPIASFAFLIGAFSLVGLPPFMGFPSKFLIVKAAILKNSTLFTIFIVLVLLCTIIEGAYFFKVIQTIYFKKSSDKEIKKIPATAVIAFSILIIIIIGLGIFPNKVYELLKYAATELLYKYQYIRSVLG